MSEQPSPGPRPAPRLIRRLVPAAALLAALAALAGCARTPPPLAKTAPPEVVVERPVRHTVTDFEDFTGRIEAYKRVDIRPEVTGKLKSVYFKDGDFVAAGLPLFEIDDELFRAQRDSAKAALGKSQAQLIRAEASLVRAKEAFARGGIAQEDLDTKQADRDVEDANVKAAKAHLVETETTLGYTRIASPYTGRISMRKVDPGNIVKADETVLTTLVVLDPVYISFDIDERTLIRIRRLIAEGSIPSARQAQLRVQVGLADEEGHTFSAVLTFADNVLDLNTGTLRLRAETHNPNIQMAPVPFLTRALNPTVLPGLVAGAAASEFEPTVLKLLSPGMFVRVRLPIGHEHPALLIPEEAIGSDQGQRFVYVLNDKDEVERRLVTPGSQEGRLRAVDQFRPDQPGHGVRPEERVIVSGHQRVRPGVKVNPKVSTAAKAAGKK